MCFPISAFPAGVASLLGPFDGGRPHQNEGTVLTDQIVEGSRLAPLGSSDQQVIRIRGFRGFLPVPGDLLDPRPHDFRFR